MLKKIVALSVFSALSLGALSAAEDEILELEDGTKLINPYIVDQTPSTVTIGHSTGAFQVPISKLPAAYQKALNYDAKKAEKYDEAKKKRKDAREAKRKEKEEKELKARIESNRRTALDTLKQQIRDLKIQIEANEDRLGKLEKLLLADKESANNLASIQPQDNSGGYSGSWGRWGLRRVRFHRGRSNRAANRATAMRNSQIRRLNDEADAIAREYSSLSTKIQEQKMELGRKEDRLTRLQEKFKSE